MDYDESACEAVLKQFPVSSMRTRDILRAYELAKFKGDASTRKDEEAMHNQESAFKASPQTLNDCRAAFEEYYGAPLNDHNKNAFTMAQYTAWSAWQAAWNYERREISDNLRSNPAWHEDDIEQLAFELAFELEDADLKVNDYVTVNREKLKAVARRVYAKLPKREIGESITAQQAVDAIQAHADHLDEAVQMLPDYREAFNSGITEMLCMLHNRYKLTSKRAAKWLGLDNQIEGGS